MKVQLRVLLVEDSTEDAELLKHALSKAGYQPAITLIQTASQMKEALSSSEWDLIISDYMIPGFGGLDALNLLQESALEIPFILISGKIGEDVAVEALKAGANDYLLKDNLTRLGAAIDRALREVSQKRKRRQAEEDLRESEERYRRLVESCPDAMFILSEGRIVFANPAGVTLLALASPVELIGRNFLELIESDYRDLVEEYLRQSLEGLDGPLLEHRMVRLDRKRILVESIARKIFYHRQEAVQVICRDISTRKSLEQQLLNAQKMEAVARLAGGVANDFNNLFTVITGYAGLIRSGLSNDHPLQRDIQQVIQSTERAIGLTNQLLAISRKEVAAPEPLNLNTVIDQIHPLIQRIIGDGIELRMNLGPELFTVQADRGQMETLFLNLAMQAKESMLHGGQLHIKTQNLTIRKRTTEPMHLNPGDYVMIRISDTGLGLTEELREHLFEPFFTKGQPGQNTGLGMATVYAVVKQHGGQITCTSQPGKGSTFQICLPASLQAAQAPMSSHSVGENGSAPVVMVVEDEDVLRDFASLILRKSGFHVLSARDGVEALKVVDEYQGPLHLVLTDVVMPRMGGAELSRRLAESLPGTRVVFTSGYPRSILVESGLPDHPERFLQKPYTMQSLLEKIREVLAGHNTTS